MTNAVPASSTTVSTGRLLGWLACRRCCPNGARTSSAWRRLLALRQGAYSSLPAVVDRSGRPWTTVVAMGSSAETDSAGPADPPPETRLVRLAEEQAALRKIATLVASARRRGRCPPPSHERSRR